MLCWQKVLCWWKSERNFLRWLKFHVARASVLIPGVDRGSPIWRRSINWLIMGTSLKFQDRDHESLVPACLCEKIAHRIVRSINTCMDQLANLSDPMDRKQQQKKKVWGSSGCGIQSKSLLGALSCCWVNLNLVGLEWLLLWLGALGVIVHSMVLMGLWKIVGLGFNTTNQRISVKNEEHNQILIFIDTVPTQKKMRQWERSQRLRGGNKGVGELRKRVCWCSSMERRYCPCARFREWMRVDM